MAYGVDAGGVYRRGGNLVGKILDGAKPADLPVERPTRFDFVVNLKTAEALGLTIPPSVLQQATALIQ
jgi:putative ABC transport system substrate-binding protein